jgi:16S rRNA (guanine966-N2)-methyltransferase
LRVIAGQYRGSRLKSPPSLDTRPTSDRLRETLFNVIAPRIRGVRFLDLCAGSGAVGIEALSRGAAHATFVDRSRQMGQLIEANLDLCGVGEDLAQVVIADAAEFLRRRLKRKGEPWGLVFFDPPYAEDYLPVLQLFGKDAPAVFDKRGLLIVEHHHKNDWPEVIGTLHRQRVLKQGDSALSFYELEAEESEPTPAPYSD